MFFSLLSIDWLIDLQVDQLIQLWMNMYSFITNFYKSSVFKMIHNNNDNFSDLPSIFDTQPFETWRILEISQGRAPLCANSTIFCLKNRSA